MNIQFEFGSTFFSVEKYDGGYCFYVNNMTSGEIQEINGNNIKGVWRSDVSEDSIYIQGLHENTVFKIATPCGIFLVK